MKGGKGFFVFPVHWLRVDSIEMQAFNQFHLERMYLYVFVQIDTLQQTSPCSNIRSYDKISAR